MKKICSIVLFLSFLLLCGWETLPKFYEAAISEVARPLFVAATKKHNDTDETDNADQKTKEIDYRELTKGINTDGA